MNCTYLLALFVGLVASVSAQRRFTDRRGGARRFGGVSDYADRLVDRVGRGRNARGGDFPRRRFGGSNFRGDREFGRDGFSDFRPSGAVNFVRRDGRPRGADGFPRGTVYRVNRRDFTRGDGDDRAFRGRVSGRVSGVRGGY